MTETGLSCSEVLFQSYNPFNHLVIGSLAFTQKVLNSFIHIDQVQQRQLPSQMPLSTITKVHNQVGIESGLIPPLKK